MPRNHLCTFEQEKSGQPTRVEVVHAQSIATQCLANNGQVSSSLAAVRGCRISPERLEVGVREVSREIYAYGNIKLSLGWLLNNQSSNKYVQFTAKNNSAQEAIKHQRDQEVILYVLCAGSSREQEPGHSRLSA